MSRIWIYVLTFMTYATIHMMRVAYSFNKHTFQKIFGIDNLFLGIVDASIYITLSLGTFLRYSVINGKKPVESCLYTAIPTAIAYSVTPIVCLLGLGQQLAGTPLVYVILLVSFGFFGFFQLSFVPATLNIFSHHFNLQQDGKLVGIWSSRGNIGNIFGYFTANFLVYTLNIRWQFTMLFCALLLLIVCFLLYKMVPNPQFKLAQEITTKTFFKYFLQIFNQRDFKLYILTLSFFRAILYSYDLWTPKFLASAGFKQYSGYIPMLYDVSTLIGSFVIGMIYQKQKQKHQQKGQQSGRYLLRFKFFVPAVVSVIVCLGYILLPGSLFLYFALQILMGLFVGGIYNGLENNEVMKYTKNEPQKTDMFSTINIGIGCTIVGISQFVIGLVLNLQQNQHQGEGQFVQKGFIYIVIAALGIITAILTFLRSLSVKKKEPYLIEQKSQNYGSLIEQ